ncbi:serine protease inhibitor 88Ea-like isoform X1 [Diorhabda carinulata]|uniref:serine protease inhibitor 88Ea-like isoform X1 n=1 Tax=Diorhabda carinulata TaxID=1163345 RepID=UPI0025A031AC|nr:serine protease inhibitor 88Ea-like isoform X1 [Diorhabda carinulata]
MKITFVIALLVTVFYKETVQQCFPPYAGNQPNRKGYFDLYSGQQEFSLALLHAVNKVLPNENLFFSPYSTYHALLMAYFLSGRQTENYLKKVLRLNANQEKSDLYAAYKIDKFSTQLFAKNASYEFTSANKIYVENDVPVKTCVLDDFNDELEMKDFKTNPEQARISINQWVENVTHHMIRDLIPPGTIDSATNLVLVNAAYFKGLWENKFPEEFTRPEIFYVSPTKQIMVDMMHVEGTFKHDVSESLGAHILEMPYKGDNISMYVLLPPWSDTQNAIENTLKNLTLENFKNIVENDNLISKTVQVSFPKFSLETTLEMTPILGSIGLENLFNSNADFSSLSPQSVYLGEGIHKSRIDVDENGTQSSSATAFLGFRIYEGPVTRFICNRTFIYFIYNKKSHTVLFVGIMRSPNKAESMLGV